MFWNISRKSGKNVNNVKRCVGDTESRPQGILFIFYNNEVIFRVTLFEGDICKVFQPQIRSHMLHPRG